MKIATFTKSFQDWPIVEVCRRFREIGLDGLDLTVRRGGHIEPKDAADRLPAAVRTAQEAGVHILLVTSDITDPTPEAEALFAACGKLGIDRVKLGYYRYTKFGTLRAQMDDARKRIAAVAKLARKHGVLACVHIHSGTFLPSHGTQAFELVRDMRPDEVGVYADMLHMALEGSGDGWRQGLDLLRPWIALVAVKNFAWQPGERDQRGRLRWRERVVPVADGISPIPEFAAVLAKEIRYDGVYSLHSEYKGGGSFKDMSTEECLAQTEKDLKFFRGLFA